MFTHFYEFMEVKKMERRFDRPRFDRDRRSDGFRGGGFRERRDDLPKPVNEGEEYDVEISEVGAKGDGIARVKNFVIFVPESKEGEKCKIRIKMVRSKFAVGEKVGKSEGKEKELKKEPAEDAVEDEESQEEDTLDNDEGDEGFDEDK